MCKLANCTGRWRYVDLDGLHTLTCDQILAKYWNYWQRRIAEAESDPSTMAYWNKTERTAENCIEDWIVVHWAWPVSEGVE